MSEFVFLDEFIKDVKNGSFDDEITEKISDDVNQKRVKEVLYVEKLMRALFRNNPNTTITCKLHEPFRDAGCVSVVAPRIEFDNIEMFLASITICDTFEAYVLTNGNAIITFSFDGLMESV